MDGFLPPVDAASWLDFQRKRAQRVAQERIRAAGAGAGDWLGRATQAVDTLVPDWAQPPLPPTLEAAPQAFVNQPAEAPLPSPAAGVGDWAQGALARIGQIGGDVGQGVAGAIDAAQGIHPSAAGLQDFSDRQAATLNATADRYAAERPELPYPAGVLAGAGGEAWQGLGRVQQQTRQAVDTLAGFGPTGADLPAQVGAGVQVGFTPFTIGGQVASELAGAAGGLPETQAAAQGVASTVGPGGTIGSIRGGLASNAPNALRAAPAALAPAGAAIGVGTGIAAGAPPEEVLTRGFEGANIGAGAGELAAGLAPAATRGLQGLARRFGTEAAPALGIVDGAGQGAGKALREAPVDERHLSIWAPGRGYIEGQPGDRMHVDIARRHLDETGERLPPTSVRVDVRPASSDGTRPPEIALSPFDQTPSLTQERAALRAAIAQIAKDTPPEWRLSVMLNDMSEYQGLVGDGAAGLRRTGHYSARQDYGDDVFGIRRGQRGLRAPRLTPEEQAQRLRDDEAEGRVLDAIQRLWRRGPDGEDAADELRFLAVGKGEAGERAARELLASRGLEDVLPAPPAGVGAGEAAGIAARPGVRSALDAALASVRPYGAATTRGERAFDLAGGTAGGIAGALTADEDATWQERAKRGAAGAIAGSLVGPTARGALGQLAPLGADDVLGAAAGRGAGKRARRAAALAAQDTGRVKLSDIPTILGSVPLMAPSSLGANFTGGMARTLERVAGQAVELRPVDAAADLLAMLREVPGAASRLARNARRGPTAAAQGAMGAPVAGDLSTRGGLVPGVLTSGVRANSATDQFWRDLNEAGARAVAGRRGLGTAQANKFATRAGDYATFTGTNSIVANKLTEMKRALHDPNASAGDKAIAGFVTATAPYIMMPERLLRATVLAPVEQAVGVVAALKRGDKAAAREAAGRLGAGLGAMFVMKSLYDQRKLTGDPPQDANERRRREAQGEQWNTIELPGLGRVPTRYLGSVGMQASLVASVMDAAARAEAKGADPGAVWEARASELAGWSLDNSYLSDLTDFLTAVGERRFGDAARQTAAGTLARPLPILPGVLNAADPYEREPGSFPEMVAGRTGLRSQVPTRIDPTTGEDQRRRGSGLSRYFGERGAEMTPEATELARLGLQPRVLSRTEEFEGAKQTPAQRRAAQRVSGSETGRALRAAINSPGYREAPDAEKKRLLQAALREAATRADIAAGEQVARSPQSAAEREWQAVPKYQGVEGTPDEIRRRNAEIARAKAAQAAAKKQGDEALDRWERNNPAQADLAATKPLNPRYLALDREEIEAKHGVRLGD